MAELWSSNTESGQGPGQLKGLIGGGSIFPMALAVYPIELAVERPPGWVKEG